MMQLFSTQQGPRTEAACRAAPHGTSQDGPEKPDIDKWALLKALSEGRKAFGLTDRNVAVLSALLSFHPHRSLSEGALTVFPSNASLAGRLHGMPESTLRRHIALLVKAGLIARCDSPNGKRYAMRDGNGRIDQVFGFDLSPLLRQAHDIACAAQSARETARQIRRTRQSISLLLRDLLDRPAPTAQRSDEAALCCADIQRLMRRKLDLGDLSQIEAKLRLLIDPSIPDDAQTARVSANDSQNERHLQNADSDDPDSDIGQENQEHLVLEVVMAAIPEMESYATIPVGTWQDLHRVADFVRPMLGITAETWAFARQRLGKTAAAITLGCILQKFDKIRKPGAYLRHLAQTDRFRVGPMVAALQPGRMQS